VTAAALVMLMLGITAGLGPGKHTCVSQTPHQGPHSCVAELGPEALHLEDQGDIVCFACLLRAQFSSLTVSIVPPVLPPQESTTVGTERRAFSTSPLHLHWDARAPPNGCLDTRTV
jgi:hypothetical protein